MVKEKKEERGRYEKGGKKSGGRGMGSMGNRYKVSQSVVLLGRQREQGCGCCLPLIEEGFRAA